MFLLVLCAFVQMGVFGQQKQDGRKSSETRRSNADDPEYLKWKIVLDGLAQAARTDLPEERRPYAMADVASAYWLINKADSKAQFLLALDRAIALFRSDKKYKRTINYVISKAARRDGVLAKALVERLAEDQEGAVSLEAALDLVEENPELAAKIGEALAPNGLADGTAMFLIFRLAQKDLRLSDEVFSVYLNAARASEAIPIEAVITMAGYALGYTEYYSVGRSGNLVGASLRPIPDLRVNPALASAFLNLAHSRIVSAVNSRNSAAGEDVTARNYPILFAVSYLLPEVGRVAPGSLAAWQQLNEQANVGVLFPQVQAIQRIVAQIGQIRARTRSFNDSSQSPEGEAEASLENVEKLAGTCQRDVVYSKAALLFSSRKNFKRAFELANKIEDAGQEGSVKQAIYIAEAEAAIKNGDLPLVWTTAEKISSAEQKAILFVEAGSQPGPDAQAFILEAVRLAEKFSKDKDKAGVLFSASSTTVKTDWQEAFKQFRSGIAYLNKDEAVDEMSFSIPIRVSLSCGGEGTWWGGESSLPNSTLFEAVRVLAGRFPDLTLRESDEISDKLLEVRAGAIVSEVWLTKRSATSGEDRSRRNP